MLYGVKNKLIIFQALKTVFNPLHSYFVNAWYKIDLLSKIHTAIKNADSYIEKSEVKIWQMKNCLIILNHSCS